MRGSDHARDVERYLNMTGIEALARLKKTQSQYSKRPLTSRAAATPQRPAVGPRLMYDTSRARASSTSSPSSWR